MPEVAISPEVEAINKVAEQIKGFERQLGERASKQEFSEVQKDLTDLKKNIGNWDGETVESAMKKINDANEKIHKQLEEMAEDVAKTKENGQSSKGKLQLVDHDEVKKFIADTFVDGRKTSNKASFKINGNIVFKAAEIMGYPQTFAGSAEITAFTGSFIDPILYQRARKKNFILDNMPIESIGVPTLIYLEKLEVAGDDGSVEDVGGAAWIVSGGQKPMRSFRLTSTQVEAKKVAIFGTVHDKLLRDVPSFENWLREDFTDEVRETYNDGLLNNNPGVDPLAPLGLKQNAIQYADTTPFNNTIEEANEIDAIVAAAAYMTSLKEQPALAVVSSSIYFKLFVLKDLQARYQNSNLVYTNAQGQIFIAGIRVAMADTEDIPDTHLMMIGVSGFKIKNYGTLVFERGLNGEDFRFDRTSFRAYQEVLSYIASHRYNSVLYDTFVNIITAIGA